MGFSESLVKDVMREKIKSSECGFESTVALFEAVQKEQRLDISKFNSCL